MVVDEKMDVGDEGRQRDLVQEDADENRGIDGQHQPPGILPEPRIHRPPEVIRWALSHSRQGWRNGALSSLSSRTSERSERDPGPITTNVCCCATAELQLATIMQSCGYGSRLSPGRQWGATG